MLFSTWQFILVFLPISLIVYFALNKARLVCAGKVWLVAASLFFYSWWDVGNLPLIVASILINYILGTRLARSHGQSELRPGARQVALAGGITFNLLILGFYKYTDFILTNVNLLASSNHPLLDMILPLAVSFFTFTQIAYLVDSYRGETAEYDLLNYSLFVTFFPHLIAGPIVHHRALMRQFASPWTLAIRYPNILRGLVVFAIGLFKKVGIADTFAKWANAGFDGGMPLDFFSAWGASLSYTFQLYFDFSGYCDMAVGASLMFSIRLPVNFNSPYKALDIQDFWRRWHITLSGFLREYLYVPLGGNRQGEVRTSINLMVVFVLGGLWHGASWMFVIWGTLHGVALVVHRQWDKLQRPMPAAVAWFLTFMFVNATWVFFRARDPAAAMKVLRGMVDVGSIWELSADMLPTAALAWGGWMSDEMVRWLPAGLVGNMTAFTSIAVGFVLIHQKNSMEIAAGALGRRKLACSALLFTAGLYFALTHTSSVFLYYNF